MNHLCENNTLQLQNQLQKNSISLTKITKKSYKLHEYAMYKMHNFLYSGGGQSRGGGKEEDRGWRAIGGRKIGGGGKEVRFSGRQELGNIKKNVARLHNILQQR